MKLGVKEMKREYKKVNIDQIEVLTHFQLFTHFSLNCFFVDDRTCKMSWRIC